MIESPVSFEMSPMITNALWPLIRVKSVANSIPVPPSPLTEQTRLVVEIERRLSVSDELESVVKANLQRANRLRQSIPQNTFTGKLT